MNTDKLEAKIPESYSLVGKKRYTPPTLIEYGNISDLTEFGGGNPEDVVGGSSPEAR